MLQQIVHVVTVWLLVVYGAQADHTLLTHEGNRGSLWVNTDLRDEDIDA